MADLSYRTFSSLMASIKMSLHLYADNNLIKDANYIGVARAINAELGIKINQQKEEEIEVENNFAYLPDDCLSIIAAIGVISKEDCERLEINKRVTLYPLSPTRRALSKFSKYSLNRKNYSKYQVDIDDGEMNFNFENGRVLLVYTAELVDEDGNLLVLDHPLINEYYEAAIKAQILKDLWYNMDADTAQKYQNETERVLPPLRKRASSIINFPGYKKLKEYQREVEINFYRKYYSMIV